MRQFVDTFRGRRDARTGAVSLWDRRAIRHAIEDAATPGMREELRAVAIRQHVSLH